MFDSNDKYSKTNSLSTSLSKALQNSKFQNFTSCWTTFESFSQKNVFLVLSSFWQLTKQFAFCYFMLLCLILYPNPPPSLPLISCFIGAICFGSRSERRNQSTEIINPLYSSGGAIWSSLLSHLCHFGTLVSALGTSPICSVSLCRRRNENKIKIRKILNFDTSMKKYSNHPKAGHCPGHIFIQ